MCLLFWRQSVVGFDKANYFSIIFGRLDGLLEGCFVMAGDGEVLYEGITFLGEIIEFVGAIEWVLQHRLGMGRLVTAPAELLGDCF